MYEGKCYYNIARFDEKKMQFHLYVFHALPGYLLEVDSPTSGVRSIRARCQFCGLDEAGDNQAGACMTGNQKE
jgi:hypothetical protein